MTDRLQTNLRTLVTSAILLATLEVSCQGHGAKSQDVVVIDLTRLQLRQNDPSLRGRISLVRVASVRSLPEAVRSRIPKMSNPGGLFNATDTSSFFDIFFDVPRHRLIFGGISDRYCLVHYEYGGIAHGYETALFAISGNQSMPLWANVGGRYSDLKEFARETNPNALKNEVNDIF